MNPSPKHVLVIACMIKTHDAMVKENCRITWFVNKKLIKPEFQDRPCHHIFMFNGDTTAELLANIALTIHQQDSFDAIGCFHDQDQPIALVIAKRLGLPFHSQKTIDQTRNKYTMRQQLVKKGLGHTQAALIQRREEFSAFLASCNKIQKFILKPVDGTGSENVQSIDRATLTQQIEQQEDCCSYPILIEAFIEGQEFSVEGFTHDGVHHIAAITEKFKTEDGFMEMGHLVPARISPDADRRIRDYVQQCLTALEVAYGPTHSEVIINDREVFLVETHTRVGGDSIPFLVELATGIDLHRLTALQILNQPIPPEALTPKTIQSACVMFKVQEGVDLDKPAKTVEGDDVVEKLPGVKHVWLNYQPGEKLPPVRHSFDRAASVTLVDDDTDRALTRVNDALNQIKFVFE